VYVGEDDGAGRFAAVRGIDLSEDAANARLIAAAPDLLACLENLARLAKIEDDNFGNGALSLGSYEVGFINAAIAKATGE
jgi:hypothetical protein